MEKVTIEVEMRNQTGKHALVELRKSGKVPAVLYGGAGKSMMLQLTPRQLASVLGSGAKHHTLFQLQVQGGEQTLAMIAETQWEPVKGTLRHVDFKRVLMDRKIRVHVPINITGDARGIKEQGGVLEVVLRDIEIECLPADLVEEFAIDATPMMLNDAVRVSDLQARVGERVRFLREQTTVICHLITPKAVEEVKPAETAEAGAAEPEVIKKGKVAEEGEEAEASSEKGDKKAEKKKDK